MKYENSSTRYLIAGLGNPGKEFRNTPHNIGWRVIEAVAEENNCGFKNNKAVFGKICNFNHENKKILLLLPETFMNKSGLSIRKALRYWRVDLAHFLVVQDDSDIALGKIKVATNQRSGGHKGLSSIIQALGSQNFARVKIGVRPLALPQGGKKHIKAEKFILGTLPKKQQKQVTTIAKEAIYFWLKEGLAKAMNKYNIHKQEQENR